ncbi:MAG: prepilin-type N-terminal cleavage/methylation domain-containing protein [Myxococcota bacterium]|nr:prepilin-type N-terminal cleavage/methylation domain-containing protein [Myxococcota bacterium]
MRKLHTRKRGFTLIELMIVVAIIGILAAIAIPNFLRFQLRSRVGEGKTNIAAIRTAQESYNAEYGTYVAAAAAPATGSPSNAKRIWPASPPGFNTVGWFPEGEVYYNYTVVLGTAVGPVYSVGAFSDIDADGTFNSWGYIHALPGQTTGIAGPPAGGGAVCPNTGTYNGLTTTNDLVNTTGPCSVNDGQNIF